MNMRKSLLLLLATAVAVVALPARAIIPAASQAQAIEFYNATLDHYFVTADPAEASDLDTGVHPGWTRTGIAFQVLKTGAANLAGSTPVCRFYGKPSAGLDSHFYTSSPVECAAVKQKFPDQWQFESAEVFRAFPVDAVTGKCPAETGPVYRLWNNRADVNHRYTDQLSVYQQMVAKGYVPEGDGDPKLPVAFCTPIGTSATPTPAPAGSPICSITAPTPTPAVGAVVTLSATCTGAPTSFSWTGCTSTTTTCQATSTIAGTLTYALSATNNAGTGSAAQIALAWQGASGPVPQCTISAASTTPQIGTNLVLSASCSQTPTSYNWVECNYMLQSACNTIPACSPTSPNCAITSGLAGFAHYGVDGVNAAGTGPRAGFDVEWKNGGTTTPTVPSCSLTASSLSPVIGTSIVLSVSCSGSPTTFTWTGCASTGANCGTTSANVGALTYSVVGSNAVGKSTPASVTVNWQTAPVPNCTVSSNKNLPTAGYDTVTLTANCSANPTSYQWTGCTPSGAQCSAQETAAGLKTYSVIAANNAGASASASANVNWQAPPTSVPGCTLTANPTSPFTGGTVTLTASCNNQPTSYTWSGCSSKTSTCIASSANAGTVTYGVQATNIVGVGALASIPVTWQQSTAPPDFCSAYNDVVRVSRPWGGLSVYPADYGGAFRSAEILVVSFTVPAGAANFVNTGFSAVVTEYQGAPTFRDMRLSRSACDFNRSLDTTGQNGPISIGSNGQTVTVAGTIGTSMLPGETYYISVRNWNSRTGNTCATSTCNLMVGGFQWPN